MKNERNFEESIKNELLIELAQIWRMDIVKSLVASNCTFVRNQKRLLMYLQIR